MPTLQKNLLHLDKLQSAGILPADFVEIRKAAASQLRAEINCKVIDALSIPETEDAARFERLRIELGNLTEGKRYTWDRASGRGPGMTPLPAPHVPCKTEFECFDNAVRQVLSVSKEEILKREKRQPKEPGKTTKLK